MPIRLNRPALIPVIELSPGDFSRTARSSPDRLGSEVPEEWRAYWKASIADQGLVLEPLALPGSWSVPLVALTNPESIRTIALISGRLGETLATPDELPIEERICILSGGFAIADGADILWHDACCADLTDLGEWRELFESPPAAKFLGHTWVRSTASDDFVEVSVKHEYSKQVDGEFQIAKSDIQQMLSVAAVQVQEFKVRLGDALRTHVPEEKRGAIVSALMGE